MEGLIKIDKENKIIEEIFKREKVSVKDLLKIPELPKNSIYRHINDLISQELVEKISKKPIVITFPLSIKLFLLKIQNEEFVKLNELDIFGNEINLRNTEVLKRFIDVKILTIKIRDTVPYVSFLNNTHE